MESKILFCITGPTYLPHRSVLKERLDGNPEELEEFCITHQVVLKEALDQTLTTGETLLEYSRRKPLTLYKIINHFVDDKKKVHAIVFHRDLDWLISLAKNDLQGLVNEKVNYTTPLDIALSLTPYPRLSKLLLGGENTLKGKSDDEEVLAEISSFITITSTIMDAGAVRGGKYVDRKEGVLGVFHWEFPGIALGLAAWMMVWGEEKKKAEMLVKRMVNELGLNVMLVPGFSETIKAWNTGREEAAITGGTLCLAYRIYGICGTFHISVFHTSDFLTSDRLSLFSLIFS